MTRKYYLLLVVFLYIAGYNAFACKYNVRDMGFVDLEDRPYMFYLYLDNPYGEGDIQNYKRFFQRQLQGTNARGQVVHVSGQKDHPALALRDEAITGASAGLLLIDAEGDRYTFPPFNESAALEEQVRLAITEVLTSPFRETIQDKCLEKFGIVLLVEGRDRDSNKSTAEAVIRAIESIKLAMNTMPKRISQPPEFVTLNWEDRSQDRLFLWSQGLLDKDSAEPSIIIFYGRLRRMGPVLTGREITEERVTNMLSVIGADCECGLDRTWLQGEMMPAKWDSDQLMMLAEQLGFDTENPMIKIEMSQILQKGRPASQTMDFNAIKGIHLGYQEIEVVFDAPESAQQAPVEVPSVDSIPEVSLGHETSADAPVQVEPEIDQEEFQLWNPLYVIGAAGAVILIVGSYVVISGKKR